MEEVNYKMNRRFYMRAEFLIILLAFIIVINSQFSSLINRYVINDDVRQHIYWMQQFHDRGLFRNDLLTEYAKNYQPWGFIFLYYLFSFIADPLLISKILPIILFVLSSLYLFKLVKYLTNDYAALLAALFFMITPAYLERMSGGLPRAFASALLIIFLYYLIKREYMKSSLILLLQSLFYPMIFFVSILTYIFTFVKVRNKRISFDKSTVKNKAFICLALIAVFILGAKYTLSYNPRIGRVVSHKQMLSDPAYYAAGRYPVLPTPPLSEEISNNLSNILFSKILMRHPENFFVKSGILNNAIFLIAILLLGFEAARRRMFFPVEILFLFLSSVLMYKISDLVLLKLFLPARYVEYSIPIISLIVYSMAIGQLITRLKNDRTKKVFQIIVFIIVLSNYNIHKKNIGLINMSRFKDLYAYLNSLPKDVMIAANPKLADGIPTFSQRKVFINYELSHPFYDKYWETIRRRTFDFFDAYYSQDPLYIYKFCENNGIEYLVVDRRHFKKGYLANQGFYFEPFNAYVVDITKKRVNFALADISEQDKLFVKGDVFVIKKDALKYRH